MVLFLLGNGPTLYGESNSDELSPLLFTVTADYRSITDSYTETSVVDLRPYINTDAPYDPIVEELRNLRQEVTKLIKFLEK